MWMNIHKLWQDVEIISKGVMLTNLIMLFFASMIPFLTIYLGKNLNEIIPQILYGVDILLVTICNQISVELIKKYNPSLGSVVKKARVWLFIIVLLIVFGIIASVTVFSKAIMIGVLLALICIFIQLMKRKSN